MKNENIGFHIKAAALAFCIPAFLASAKPAADARASADLIGSGHESAKSVYPGNQSLVTSAATMVPDKTTKRYIVSLDKGALPDDFCARRGLRMLKQTRNSRPGFAAHMGTNDALVLPAANMVICDLTAAQAGAARAEHGVRAVEADGPVSLCGQTNSFGLIRIGADHFPVAHINGQTNPLDVVVAIIDTGIDPHEDLDVAHFWSPFTSDPSDELGHGTAVAGVVAAKDNGFGVVGVAPGVNLWNIKVLNAQYYSWSGVLQGIDYCAQNADQISVANISLSNVGTYAPYDTIRRAVQNMVKAGIVVVAAAGNSDEDLAGADLTYGTGDDFVPAAIPEAMAVSAIDPTIDAGSTNPRDVFWDPQPGVEGSNHSQIPQPVPTDNPDTNIVYPTSPGNGIDVAAPGNNILTTAPFLDGTNVYILAAGTSLAAPHVAGLVALYIAANGRATNEQGVYNIRQAIIDAGQPQSLWATNDTHDPDTNHEPLAIATEAWVPHPDFTAATGAPGHFQVSFAAVPGYDYTVQSATNLTSPGAWTDLTTLTGSNFVTAVSVTDTNAAAQTFYQLKRTPTP